MAEVKLVMDFDDKDDQFLLYPSISSEAIMFCRICHEAEFESSKSMESPCYCSGTVKFAHRDCIQRWCDEKGNTTCEICLQKLIQNHTEVRLVVTETDVSYGIVAQQERIDEAEFPQCSSSADTTASICRFLGLAVTLLLLVRHLLVVLVEGTGDYPFTLLTLLIMRASGILVPMYIIMYTVDTIHKTIRSRYQVS